jgi:hypothetical protein
MVADVGNNPRKNFSKEFGGKNSSSVHPRRALFANGAKGAAPDWNGLRRKNGMV